MELYHGPHINDLPRELLVQIMSNLSLFHRKRTREVCQYWNDISYDRSLIRNDWMVVPSAGDLKKLEGRHPDRIFTNIRIEKVAVEYEQSDVWQKFGPFIRKVECHDIDYAANPIFYDIFYHCTDLRYLGLFWHTLRDETDDDMSELVSLTKLASMTSALTTLTSVTVENCPMHLTAAVINSFKRNSQHLTEICLDDFSDLTTVEYSSFSNLLNRHSKVLTHLTLSEISGGEIDLSGLLSCVGEQLVSLNISGNGELTEEFLSSVCKHFPNLEEINLSQCFFPDEGMKMIFTSLKKLSAISLGHTDLTDDDLQNIACVDNLKKLDLTGCNYITDEGLKAAFNQRPLPKLEVVIFQRLNSITDETIELISRMAPNITSWDLSNTYIGDSAVRAIIRNNKDLRSLSLHECNCVKDIFSGTPSINDSEYLEELSMNYCTSTEYSLLKHLRLRHLKKLKILSFQYYGISDFDFYGLLANLVDVCPSLEEVDMGFGGNDIDKESLPPQALKVLRLPCDCPFSPRHSTRKCRP